MRILKLLVILGSILIFPAEAMGDLVLWYNGDYGFGGAGTGNEITTNRGSLVVYDDFQVFDSGWTVTSAWSNNSMFTTNVNQASWEIRNGMAQGVGGTVVASGISQATQVPTGRSGIPHNAEYTVRVTGLNVYLEPGTYWLSVAPIVGNDAGIGGFLASYLSETTLKANSVGSPFTLNGNSLIKTSIDDYFPLQRDYSMGIEGFTAVPEPSSLILLPIALFAFTRKKRIAESK